MSNRPLIFIYQFGFSQISLPPMKEGVNNFDVINIDTCEDGCRIKTKQDLKESYLKLKEFVGREVIKVYCDRNEISYGSILERCEVTQNDYGSDVIFIWT